MESGFADAVGLRFNHAVGDKVSYTIAVPETAELPHLLIRYRLEAGKRASLRFSGLYGGWRLYRAARAFCCMICVSGKKRPANTNSVSRAYGGRTGLFCSGGEAAAYRVSVNGEPVDGAVLEPGTVALSLETGASLRAPQPYRLEIVPR